MTMKDKLAATLLNHWYCIERGLAIHRLKRVPSKKDLYASLDGSEAASDNDLQKMIDKFSGYNGRAFSANIEHLVKQDNAITKLGAVIKSSKTRQTIRVEAIVEDLNLTKELEAIAKALQGKDQSKELSDIVKHLPRVRVGSAFGRLVISVPCSTAKGAYFNMAHVEDKFVKQWDATKSLFAIREHVFNSISEENKNDILSGRVHVNFIDPKIENNIFVASAFTVVETPRAREQREIRERLEKALRDRTKKVQKVEVKPTEVVYNFEDTDTQPLSIALNIVTHW